MVDHSNLKGKNVLLAVTGGIGAYKSVEIARALVRIGAEVSVVMTRNATRFITPLTMEALTRNPRSEERRVGKECRSRGSPYH